MTDAMELKPCPFCGGTLRFDPGDGSHAWIHDRGKCFLSGAVVEDGEEGLWNIRPTPTPSGVTQEELRGWIIEAGGGRFGDGRAVDIADHILTRLQSARSSDEALRRAATDGKPCWSPGMREPDQSFADVYDHIVRFFWAGGSELCLAEFARIVEANGLRYPDTDPPMLYRARFDEIAAASGQALWRLGEIYGAVDVEAQALFLRDPAKFRARLMELVPTRSKDGEAG